MSDNDKKQDTEIEKELAGVPEQFLDNGGDDSDDDGDQDTGENTGENTGESVVEALRAELEEARQQVLYAKADTQNVRRRLEKDIADARAYAATGFARDILSVADNLTRALDAVPEDMREHSKLEGLVAGIEATQRELDKVFGQHGITRIASKGLPLDPNQHQAMMEIPSNEVEPGTVVQEMQPGYMIKDRLLRPAMVAVSKKPD
ncbi:nucleotide exchange factor GrpE [Alteraurantiacibacter aestuarii]|uniref:nucleotide exchange factor GrpE n=1 Tax=Alteraurantiacibacter aestuarii TaxID=650004 RepID=UPI0031DBC8DB